MRNIIQVYKQFPTHDACIERLEAVRWGDKPKCPYCKSFRVTSMAHRYHCNACNTSFSVTVGTVAVASLAYSSSKALYEMISTIQDAPQAFQDLSTAQLQVKSWRL